MNVKIDGKTYEGVNNISFQQASGSERANFTNKIVQTKTLNITSNGTHELTADEGKMLGTCTVSVNVT